MQTSIKKNNFTTKLLATALTLLAFFSPEAANSATATTGFRLSVVVGATCQVNASDMDFGKIDDFTINNDSTSTLKILCTEGLPFQVGIDQGSFGKNTSERLMQNQTGSAEMLSYQIFMDESRSRNWGNIVDKDTFQDKGRGDWVGYTVFGRIPAQKAVGIGEYVDKVQVTITY